MDTYEIEFYDLPNGKSPAQDFLDSLDVKMRAKMLRCISLLAENGPALRMPHSEHLDDGIFEVRAKVGTDISRVLYFFVVGRRIILTNGFIKKTQKTPPAEINRAKEYRRDYLSRKEQQQ